MQLMVNGMGASKGRVLGDFKGVVKWVTLLVILRVGKEMVSHFEGRVTWQISDFEHRVTLVTSDFDFEVGAVILIVG